MPSAGAQIPLTGQGSSTIAGSPGRSKVRLTMSSAWVAPTVMVMMCSTGVHVERGQLLGQHAAELPSPAARRIAARVLQGP